MDLVSDVTYKPGVESASVWRWMLAHAARQPGTWVLLALGLVAAPLSSQISPLGSVGVDPAVTLARAWVAPFGLLGAVLGLRLLGRHGAFLRLLPNRTRWVGEAGGLLLWVFGGAAPVWIGAGAFDGALPGSAAVIEWGSWSVHVVAVALVLLRWDVASTVRVVLLPALVWILPGFLTAGGAGFRPLFDGGAYSPLTSSGSLFAGILATTALFLVSFLLACPSPPPHPDAP